jgi:hypothetical protein
MRSKVVERNGRRRFVALCSLVATAVTLGAGAAAARPAVDVATPTTTESTPTAPAAVVAAHATVSGDGRFVASQGRPTDPADPRESTVFLLDRADGGEPREMTTVPQGARSGNSLHPVLSGDGCSLIVVTQLALDVFRDDDTGDRWDVYRQRLEHCGGTPGAWELVSVRPDGSALARDDVSTVDPPAVSRSGTLIAYTHPATQLIDAPGVTSVSLVDLALPPSDPLHTVAVAGTPISSPDTEFVHRGLDQPAISGDGRFVAFRSDADSVGAVPGWGTGQEPGGPATPQIFVWDRAEPDPFLAVRLMSARGDGQPTLAGAAEPVLSRDGRVVAFTSADLGLVPAVFPPCSGASCPTQVFRVDRDTDGNGLYDEPGRTSVTMVSSVPGSDPRVAGTGPSSQPSVSADGQLTAFVTKARNLQLVQAAGGGEPTDGDLLVSDARLGTLRRVTVTADGVRPAVAAHARPRLSDTGRTTVFDTLAAPQLVAGGAPGRQVVALDAAPALSLAEADLGTTLVGFTSDEWYVAVINNGPTTFTPSRVTVSDRRFVVNQTGSTCALGAPVPPGGDCTVRITFTPDVPGPVSATLTVAEEGFRAVSVSSTVRGAGGDPTLRTNPAGADLGVTVVGQPSGEFVFDVENIALAPTSISRVSLAGAHPADFAITSNTCLGRALNPRASCSVGVTFTPSASGRRSALIEVATPAGQYTTVVAAGDGRYAPVFRLGAAEVQAGTDVLVAGEGFPPSTAVSVLFGDDASSTTIFTTGPDGTFLAWLPIDVAQRGGSRTVVAQATDGTIASAPVEVIEEPAVVVGLPGYGLGF